MKIKVAQTLITHAALSISLLVVVAGCASSATDSGLELPVANAQASAQAGGLISTLDGETRELLSATDLTFIGAFALPSADDDVSSLDWSEGTIEVNGDSMFIVGHGHHDAVAEFVIPELVKSTQISKLNLADSPRQGFVKVLDRAASGNPDALDQILGLEVVNGSLVLNVIEYYDAATDNKLSTLIVSDASDLQGSSVSEFRSMQGFARASGWLSNIPQPLQAVFGASHISGSSSGGPIIARHSVGPSAFAVDLNSAVSSQSNSRIKTTELLGYSLDRPLHDDLFNKARKNDLWTLMSQARFGFIVPGTRTYATLGWSGGHSSGVGYKITQDDGELCPGYCSSKAADNENFFWFWDLDDLIRVKKGKLSPNAVVPYEFGRLDIPFQTGEYFNPIGGASFDSVRQILYVSILKANNTLGEYRNPPIIAAFKLGK